MGNACAKGGDRADTDNMQPGYKSGASSLAGSTYKYSGGEDDSKTTSFQSSFDLAGSQGAEIFYGQSAPGQSTLSIKDF